MTSELPTSTVLIVDDHPATRKLLEDILHHDYHVLLAENGARALDLLRDTPRIDLVLLDIIMPDMNGYEVCQRIRDNPLTAEVPVVFLTIMEEDHNEARGFAVGVNDYIIKPISRLRLLARVRNQLALHHKQQELELKNRELQAALEQITTLHGILPICSFCKQIRNDQGAWQRLEDYIQRHSEAEFSHSICPKCAKEHYPEYCS